MKNLILLVVIICTSCGSAKQPYANRKQFPTHSEMMEKQKEKKEQMNFLTFGIVFMGLMIAYGESQKRN